MDSWLLAFDTATPQSTLALGKISPQGGESWVCGQETLPGPHQASQDLVPSIEGLLKQAGISWSEIELLACGIGPGTFTGTRVAVATAKGLALARNIPVFPICSLSAVAASLNRAESVISVLDARKNEVYARLMKLRPESADNTGSIRIESCSEPVCGPLNEICKLWKQEATSMIGPGITPYHHLIPEPENWNLFPCTGASSRGLWTSACSFLRTQPAIDPSDISVKYLRASYAELGMNFQARTRFISPFAKQDS